MGTREFNHTEAKREKVPLLVALVGPSGSGKTYSALELATGIQEVEGGDIFFIDTEARRSLHYADRFHFKFLPFEKPFGSLDYLAAIEYATKHGAKTVIVDSMSHEHEGPGGLLESHEAELSKIAGDDWQKRKSMSMLAWQKPKAARRRLLNSMVQMPCNFILNFRAKEKIELKRGLKEPLNLGWQPIGGEEFVFEMTLGCLLLPGCKGVPTWQSEEIGERAVIKLPRQFQDIFKDSPVLSKSVGKKLAEWARGDSPVAVAPVDEATIPLAPPEPPTPAIKVPTVLEAMSSLHNASASAEGLKAAWTLIYKNKDRYSPADWAKLEKTKDEIKEFIGKTA